ncbi:MAG: LysE/ArgO family amino acid transporter [Candidatus Poseidoniia archaeon]|nr:LysE/ArgO family amino acid transporter [Candidatus Poseidoniia archaeon]
MLAFISGFLISISLILALGPQNVFVMRQGLLRSHVFAACLVCSISDALLIGAGVLGVGLFLSEMEELAIWMSIGASIFLIFYGCLRIKSALNPKGLEVGDNESQDLWPTILAGLAFTYLNPHVYVDTLFLIGGASSSYAGDEKLMFGIGAATASFVFFFSLGYGAKRLSPILNNPESWKIIDLFIAGVMFTVAGILMFPYLS